MSRKTTVTITCNFCSSSIEEDNSGEWHVFRLEHYSRKGGARRGFDFGCDMCPNCYEKLVDQSTAGLIRTLLSWRKRT